MQSYLLPSNIIQNSGTHTMCLLSEVCQQTAEGVEQWVPEYEKGFRLRHIPREKVPPTPGEGEEVVVVGETRPWKRA